MFDLNDRIKIIYGLRMLGVSYFKFVSDDYSRIFLNKVELIFYNLVKLWIFFLIGFEFDWFV